MNFKIFTLYPELFENFLGTSLIARAVSKNILSFELINWRNFGIGNYKQVDDRPFGGGSGMVLRVEPIFEALLAHNALSEFILQKFENQTNWSQIQILPNNANFYDWQKSLEKHRKNLDQNIQNLEITKIKNCSINLTQKTNLLTKLEEKKEKNNQNKADEEFNGNTFLQRENPNQDVEKIPETDTNLRINSPKIPPKKTLTSLPKKINKVVILLTPRGFALNQKICEWLVDFDEITLLCGRFEGFDARVNSLVDLEISVGDFVTNGGEIPAMCLIEAVGRLVEGFMKPTSHEHDSFGQKVNEYSEQKKFVIGKENSQKWQKDILKLDQIHQKLQNSDLLNGFQDI